MLTPKKKISKKELKEDALVTTYARATAFYETNKRNISVVVTTVAILAIAAVIYGKNRADNNVSASTELGNVYALYDAGQYREAVEGIPERNIKGLKAIVEDYGNSTAGDIARFYLASAYYDLGKNDEALEQFKKCSPNELTLEISRLAGIACIYEIKGQYKDAGEYFEKASSKDPKDVNAAENLFNAGRNYAKAGEKETALDLLRRLKKNFSTSTFARDADRAIAGISVS